MYPKNPEGTQVIVGSMNMGYISDTARDRTHNLFRPKRESIPLGHSDGHYLFLLAYPDSSAKSSMIKPAQCISLRDTVPTTAMAQPANTGHAAHLNAFHLSAYD